MPPELCLVTWRDAHFKQDDEDNWAEDYIIQTVGWATVDGRWLRIESERTPDGPRAITRVPLESVLEKFSLGPGWLAKDGGTDMGTYTVGQVAGMKLGEA